MTEKKNPTAPAEQQPLTVAQAAAQLENALRAAKATGQPAGDTTINEIKSAFNTMINLFSEFSVTLTPAERKRLTGAGIRNHGFIEVCYEKAQEMPAFLPSYLSPDKFSEDHADFEHKQVIYDMARRFEEMADDTLLAASDVVYHDALAFYNTVKEAARQKAPGARALFDELSPYFKSHGARKTADGEPTEKQVERDVRSLLHGTKEGEAVIHNINPHISGGIREVADEVSTARAAVRIDAEENTKK